MTTYRKLASSSIAAIQVSLERRLERLLTRNSMSQEHARDLDEIEDAFDDAEDGQDDLGTVADAIAVREVGATPFFPNETSQLQHLIESARAARFNDFKLKYFLEEIVDEVVGNGDKLLIYTEYRATQEYIVDALSNRYSGAGIAQIHGGMQLEEKLINIRNFNEGARFMVSTEAGGEGINLHEECHVMVNYDIPWNPRRLVQRAGRLYRYGQTKKVSVYNLVSEDSFDDRFLSKVLDRVHAMADQMFDVSGDTSERLRTEILGDLLEQLDIAKTLARNTDMNVRLSEEEANHALELARAAKEQQEFLFSQVEGFDRQASQPVQHLSQDDVMSFIEGMLSVKRINVRQRMYGGTVLEIELPDDLTERFSEFSNRRVVRISPHRERSLSLNNVAQMDFESPFFRLLIDEAKSPEFGGEYASVIGDQSGAFALFKLRWNNDQGEPRWQALYPVFIPNSADATGDQAIELYRELLRGTANSPPTSQHETSETRLNVVGDLQARADLELSARRSNLRYPGGIVLLAAADIVSED